MPELDQQTFTDRPEGAGGSDYRPVSALAIVSLLVGLFSLSAFWHPGLWVLPAVGVALGLVAIHRIDRRDNELLGRWLAVIAVCVSLVSISGATSRYALLSYRSRIAARELGLRWFEALRDGQPEIAFELTKAPNRRAPPGRDPAEFVRSEPGEMEYLRRFVSDPVVKAMLKLGAGARVRYLETLEHHDDGRKARLWGVYAVTFKDDEGLHSFFVRLSLERLSNSPLEANQWWVDREAMQTDPPGGAAPAK